MAPPLLSTIWYAGGGRQDPKGSSFHLRNFKFNWNIWTFEISWRGGAKILKVTSTHVVPTSWLNYLRRQFVNKFFIYALFCLSFVSLFFILFYLLFCLCTFELFFYFVLSLFSFFSFQFYHSTLLTHFKINSVKICKLHSAEPDFVGLTAF